MTSRDGLQRRAKDSLDAMIGWVLRERVGGVTPPPGVWERISERLAERTVAGARWRQGFRLAESAALWLLAVSAVGARAELPYYDLGGRNVWKGSPFYLTDQYEVLLRRLAVL
jgi:hypothetical protein